MQVFENFGLDFTQFASNEHLKNLYERMKSSKE